MSKPPDQFLAAAMELESVYLRSSDPVEQSGFHGGRARWVEERRGLTEAIDRSGDLLDVGCANGLLAQDVATWAAERGHHVVPFGIDVGARLVRLAAERNRAYEGHFIVANAWDWEPNRQWDFVYSILDLSPSDMYCDWVARLLRLAAPTGRLILGSYGSLSRGISPERPADVIRECGLTVGGTASSANHNSEFAWTNRAHVLS